MTQEEKKKYKYCKKTIEVHEPFLWEYVEEKDLSRWDFYWDAVTVVEEFEKDNPRLVIKESGI